jgi:hypothetical protein
MHPACGGARSLFPRSTAQHRLKHVCNSTGTAGPVKRGACKRCAPRGPWHESSPQQGGGGEGKGAGGGGMRSGVGTSHAHRRRDRTGEPRPRSRGRPVIARRAGRLETAANRAGPREPVLVDQSPSELQGGGRGERGAGGPPTAVRPRRRCELHGAPRPRSRGRPVIARRAGRLETAANRAGPREPVLVDQSPSELRGGGRGERGAGGPPTAVRPRRSAHGGPPTAEVPARARTRRGVPARAGGHGRSQHRRVLRFKAFPGPSTLIFARLNGSRKDHASQPGAASQPAFAPPRRRPLLPGEQVSVI